MESITKIQPSAADVEKARDIIAGRAKVGFGNASDFAELGDTTRSVVVDKTTFEDKTQQIADALVQLLQKSGGVVGDSITVQSGISFRDKSAILIRVDETILEQARNAIVGKLIVK